MSFNLSLSLCALCVHSTDISHSEYKHHTATFLLSRFVFVFLLNAEDNYDLAHINKQRTRTHTNKYTLCFSLSLSRSVGRIKHSPSVAVSHKYTRQLIFYIFFLCKMNRNIIFSYSKSRWKCLKTTMFRHV